MPFRDSDNHGEPAVEPVTREFAVPFSSLGLTVARVVRGLGYANGTAPEPVPQVVAALLEEAPGRLSPRAGYRILPQDQVVRERERLRLIDTVFDVGFLISRGLRKGRAMAVFVATAGPELDAWTRERFADDDPLGAYLVDSLGSDTVEAAADCLDLRLAEVASGYGWGRTNRFSPGYCEWHVAEQHRLFSLLPDAFCGVRLTDSALMQPEKSVSGVVGLGPGARPLDYLCALCTIENCFRRTPRPGEAPLGAAQ